jgi:hypothetical protein
MGEKRKELFNKEKPTNVIKLIGKDNNSYLYFLMYLKNKIFHVSFLMIFYPNFIIRNKISKQSIKINFCNFEDIIIGIKQIFEVILIFISIGLPA